MFEETNYGHFYNLSQAFKQHHLINFASLEGKSGYLIHPADGFLTFVFDHDNKSSIQNPLDLDYWDISSHVDRIMKTPWPTTCNSSSCYHRRWDEEKYYQWSLYVDEQPSWLPIELPYLPLGTVLDFHRLEFDELIKDAIYLGDGDFHTSDGIIHISDGNHIQAYRLSESTDIGYAGFYNLYYNHRSKTLI